MTERLYRSNKDKMIGGVCGGLSDYFHADIALVRLIALVIMFATGGIGLLAYIAAMIIIPKNPGETDEPFRPQAHNFGEGVEEVANDFQETVRNLRYHNGERSKMAGIILIILGVLFLLDRFMPYWFNMAKIWPLLLIAIGVVVIWRGEHR